MYVPVATPNYGYLAAGYHLTYTDSDTVFKPSPPIRLLSPPD